MEDTNPLQSQKQKNKMNKIRNTHREKNQNKLYLDQVGDSFNNLKNLWKTRGKKAP